jgi:hypothetical protein
MTGVVPGHELPTFSIGAPDAVLTAADLAGMVEGIVDAARPCPAAAGRVLGAGCRLPHSGSA